MEFFINLLNSNIFNSLVGILGTAFGIWQYRRASNMKKIVNDHVRNLYNDSKKILEFAKKQNNYQTIAERARSVKNSVIRLDIINRNLNKKRIEKLRKSRDLLPDEAEEYKKFSSN